MDKNHLIKTLADFLQRRCPDAEPLLLGLSGGPDSLALFYALLACQNVRPFSFHIAHIDHGWRAESGCEAQQLKQLAQEYGIPFYLKKLDPSQFQKCNLEMACRLERYRFFSELCRLHRFQGVLIGHHQDDQSETILKRVLEGAHWSCLPGLNEEIWIEGVRVLRPFLQSSKNELYSFLEKRGAVPFEDASNQDERFLRARMRQTMIPWLNENFGKNIQPALLRLGEEMLELKEYFEDRLRGILAHSSEGPFGVCLDLHDNMPASQIEIKYLLRLFCERYQMNLSHAQYQTCAEVLRLGQANQCFENGGKTLYADRQRLFLFPKSSVKEGVWRLEMEKRAFISDYCYTGWQEAWKGRCKAWLPDGVYEIGDWTMEAANRQSIDKWWTNHRIPAFLRSTFPVVFQGSEIVHEFLTGRSRLVFQAQEGTEISLIYETAFETVN